MLSYRPVLVCTLLVSLLGVAAGQGQPVANDSNGDPLPAGAVARLGSVRFGHDANVVFAAFLPDGKRVLSVSQDGVLCAWEFPSGKQLQRVELVAGTSVLVTGATLSPDGKHLTAFGDDGALRIWDWVKGKELGKVAQVGHTPKVTTSTSAFSKAALSKAMLPGGQVYSPDSKTLLLFGGSRKLQLVDLPSGKEIGASLGHNEPLLAILFTPDGKQIMTRDARITHTWTVTGKHTGAFIPAPPAIAGTPTVISPDGRYGVTVERFASPAKAQAAKVRTGYLFDTATGKVVGEVGLATEVAPVHRRPLLFSPDGKLLAASAGDAPPKIDLYEVPSGKLLRSLGAGPVAVAGKGFKNNVSTTAQRLLFSPDGKLLAYRPGPGAKIIVFDTTTGKEIATVSPGDANTAMHGAFSPDGRCLALEEPDGKVTFHELATGQARCTFDSKLPPQPMDKADALAELLGGGGPGGGFGFGGPFSSATADKTRACVAFSPNAQLLALPGDRGSVQIWDVLTGKVVKFLKGHTAAVNALTFAPDGKRLATASDDTTALLWDTSKVARPAAPAKAVQAGDLENWWQALADNDAAKAFVAMRELAAAPKEAVAWLKDRVKPVLPLDMTRVNQLLKQLDDEKFAVRDKATAELLRLGEPLLPVLDKALAADPSPEARLRLDQLRGKLTSTVLLGDRLRDFRAIELLEHIGTPEARQMLQALAAGAPGTLITSSAQAALKR